MNDNDFRGGSQAAQGVGCLCILVALVLLIAGPKNDAGHVLWWWYLIPMGAIVLWLVGRKGKVTTASPGPKGIEGWQTELQAALSAGNKELQAKAHLNLGVAFQAAYAPPQPGKASDSTLLDHATEHLIQARDLYEAQGNSERQGLALSNLAIVYYAKEQDQTAVECFRKAADIAKGLSRPEWEHQMIQRFSKLLGEMGHLGEANEVIKEYSIRRARGR